MMAKCRKKITDITKMCNKRQSRLDSNQRFRFQRPKCLTPTLRDYVVLANGFEPLTH